MTRSFLFAAATNARHLGKAIAGPAEAVILDLEDAVAVGEKATGRAAAVEFLLQQRSKPVYVRMNGLATSFAFDDLLALGAAGPDGIVLPKAESASELATVDWVLGEIEARHGRKRGGIALLPIVETAKGLGSVDAIARAVGRVRGLVFGAVDLALDMGLDLADEAGALSQPRFAVALASRQAGLEGPIDTAFLAIDDPDGLRASVTRAKRLGYTGKCCIHPAQVAIVNEGFTPSSAEIERARRIVAAFEVAEAAGSAALKLDGLMIDYPVVDQARRLLARLR